MLVPLNSTPLPLLKSAGFNIIMSEMFQNLPFSGFERFSVLGWSDGGITGIILSGERQQMVETLVVWGSNAFVSEDGDLISKVRDFSNWSAKIREIQWVWSSWTDKIFRFKYNEDGICKTSLPKIKKCLFLLKTGLHSNFTTESG